MNAFVILAAVVACANAQVLWNQHSAWPYTSTGAITYNALPVASHYTSHVVAPLATKTQYHAQDQLGQASFGYSYPGQAQAEVRDVAGNVRGSYAYVNPNGKEVRVAYTAGHDGFRVASNDLPVAPVDHNIPAVANLIAPSPVRETPEVMQARAAHALAHHEARSRGKRSVAVIPTTSALGYSNLWNANTWNGYSYTAPTWNHATTYAAPATWNHATTYTAPATWNTASIATPSTWNYGYTAPVVSGYSTPVVSGYSTPIVSNVVATQAVRDATLTKIHNNPGHAVSYRVD